MSDDAKREAFEAWVLKEYGPDGCVYWIDEPGAPDPPYIYQDGRVALLGDVWESWLACAARYEAVVGNGHCPHGPILCSECREPAPSSDDIATCLGTWINHPRDLEDATRAITALAALAPDTTPATRGRDKENR